MAPPTSIASSSAPPPPKAKPRRRAPLKKPRKPRAGWGPYRTVVNERAVAFNLALDVQHLAQEVHSLTAARDILLAARALQQRHDPVGSLMRRVAAYYDVMRFGITPASPSCNSSSNSITDGARELGRRVYTQKEQREFLYSFADEKIDVGGDLPGFDVFFEQLRRYSVFLRFLDLRLLAFEVVNADDSVLITTTGSLHIQILRSTIAGVFPHVLDYEWLVSKLVGRKVTLTHTLSFYFNQRDKVVKYVVDLDFFKAFADLLTDPEEVDILLGRALIGDNCMFAAEIDDDDIANAALAEHSKANEEDTQQFTIRRAVSRRGEAADGENSCGVVREVSVLPPASIYSVAGTRTRVRHADVQTNDFYNEVVREYFNVFSIVAHSPNDDNMVILSDAQRLFVCQWVSLTCEFGDDVDKHGAALRVGQQALEERWCTLASYFEFLGLVQTSQDPVVTQLREGLCFVRTTAEYTLRITPRTIQCVFPHVTSEALLLHALLGGVLTVRAQLKFWLEQSSGKIACLKEEMHFDVALAQLVPHPDDLAWVLAHARLEKDGVRSDGLSVMSIRTSSDNRSVDIDSATGDTLCDICTSTSSPSRETMTSYDISF